MIYSLLVLVSRSHFAMDLNQLCGEQIDSNSWNDAQQLIYVKSNFLIFCILKLLLIIYGCLCLVVMDLVVSTSAVGAVDDSQVSDVTQISHTVSERYAQSQIQELLFEGDEGLCPAEYFY